MNNPDDFLYLIANPMKKKKTYVTENIDGELQLLLQKKFKNYDIDDESLKELFLTISEKLQEIEIKKLSKKIIEEIFSDILEHS